MKRIFLFSAIDGGAPVVTLFLLFSVFVATQDYAINVDTIKDDQYLFNTVRVRLICILDV